MRVLHSPTDLPPSSRGVCLAIGVFDGVHLGHQQVIRQMASDAESEEAHSVAITFDRHPSAVVAPERVPPQIYSLSQKLRTISSLGIEATWLVHFDEPFSRQTGEQFVRALIRDFGRIRSICVGSSFTFGHRRSGNVDLLKRLGHEFNFVVHGLAAVSLDGEAVSSTRIREAVRCGQLDLANQMLGRAYSLAGPVISGDHLGRQLGFPTANLDITGLVLPPCGVYAAHAIVHGPVSQVASVVSPGSGTPSQIVPATAEPHRAVVNLGHRPTLHEPAPQLRVEAHLLDLDADLYGQELEITFLEKIRDEQKFPSLEALKAQIARDIASAERRFGEVR